MLNFCNLDPIAHCMRTCMVNDGLFESFASDMPGKSSGGSATSNLAACGAPNPKCKKGQGLEKDAPLSLEPLVHWHKACCR